MRLDSSLVFVKHAAKEVASAYRDSSGLPDQGPTGGRISGSCVTYAMGERIGSSDATSDFGALGATSG